MPRPTVLAAAALLGSLVACNPFAPGATRTIIVDHHPVECSGPWEQLCLLIEATGDPGFSRHYGGIEGFHYEWGYVYRLTVVDRRVRNPPADGSSTRTILQRVISKERVPAGTAFDIILTTEGFGLEPVASDRYRVYGEAEFVCPPGAACDELRANVDAGARMRFRLEHPAAPADPLVLREWEVCTGGSPGSVECTS
jgi:hypothetical protein